ncbi:MAG: potassium channel family protein [Aestuariivirga sp.]|uniref:potassium channel family protein n=1 Tax=Aestuariivirga sp. TaxID=2650926 RepID=UPI0025B9F722|nr:potassium channel family protein [Aestuariivirga sp.]MCA3562707.1 potassium channel family protein [Aestuariivirga sp.]
MDTAARPKPETLHERIRTLYEGDVPAAHRFRYALLIFDLLTIAFVIATSFLQWHETEYVDAVIGVVLLVDFAARLWIARRPLRMVLSTYGLIDIVVIVSMLAPIVGEGLAFLRVARVLRLLHSYTMMTRLRQDFRWFRKNEQIVMSALNLGVFIFIMTALVYETQHFTNPEIGNYADALYFTVTALTTTGFGDVVLTGTGGRMIAVVIMIFGVSLFLRLIQVMLRPDKLYFKCPDCGLTRHDRDAVHCKACGRVLNIPDEGAV